MTGIPKPDIKWIYNGMPLEEAPFNPRRTSDDNRITIFNLTKADTGNYGCNATNDHGYVYKDVYVNVLGEIKIPIQSYIFDFNFKAFSVQIGTKYSYSRTVDQR